MIKRYFNKLSRDSNNDDGSPEIAQDSSNTNTFAIVLVSLVVFIMLGLYLIPKSKSKPDKSIQENYEIDKIEIQEDVRAPSKTFPKSEIITQKKVDHTLSESQLAFLQDKQKELQMRLTAPLMVVNEASPKPKNKTQEEILPTDFNLQFMRQVTNHNVEETNASQLARLNSTIFEGSLINAILESASNSDLPGYLRAIVSEPSYSEDGSQILIPSGSRLIGRYRSGMLQGQSRIFVVWTRLITPDGISLNLGSPGVDNLGVTGMSADAIDNHFWQRFGTAGLLSIIGAGAANFNTSSIDGQSAAYQYRSAIANSFAQSANQSLHQNVAIAPTLESYQGKQVMVFVAHDINFESAMRKSKPRINIF